MSEGVVRQPRSKRELGLQIHEEQLERAALKVGLRDSYAIGIDLARSAFKSITQMGAMPFGEVSGSLIASAGHFSTAVGLSHRTSKIKAGKRRQIAEALGKLGEDLPHLTHGKALELILDINELTRSQIIAPTYYVQGVMHSSRLANMVSASHAEYMEWKSMHKSAWDVAVVAKRRGDYETAIEYTIRDGEQRSDFVGTRNWYTDPRTNAEHPINIRRDALRTALAIAVEGKMQDQAHKILMRIASLPTGMREPGVSVASGDSGIRRE